MARLFGRLLSTIWDDEDFLALDDGDQRLYAFLLSQRNLNHAGLLPVTLRKWARKARNSTVARLTEQLTSLEKARFVVLDPETEELLVRTLVRNDNVYKQPRVMGAMVSDAREIESPRLRAVLLAEMDRIPLEDLSDKPGKNNAPSIRSQVCEHIAELRTVLRPRPTPPQPPAKPLPEPLHEPPPDDLEDLPYDEAADAVAEGDRQGSMRVHASPHAHAYPYPVSLGEVPMPPEPLAADALFDAPDAAVPGAADADKPRGKKAATAKATKRTPKAPDPEAEARSKLAQGITQTWWDALPIKPSGKHAWVASLQIIGGLLAAGHAPEALAQAAKGTGLLMTIKSMEFHLEQLAKAADSATNVFPFQRPRHQVHQNYADQSVYDIDPRAAGGRRA